LKGYITQLLGLHEVIFLLHFFRCDRPKPRDVLERPYSSLLPKEFIGLLHICIDVIPQPYKHGGIELQNCIPDRLSSQIESYDPHKSKKTALTTPHKNENFNDNLTNKTQLNQ
jgi:hypothetical protein